MKKVLAVSSVFLGVLFLAGCGQQPVSQTQPVQTKQEQKAVVQKSTETTPQAEQPKEVNTTMNCDAFPDNLNTCTKYKCQFDHLLTGEKMEKEIIGNIDGKCNYIEQMPNNGKMECKYTTSQRTVVAQYYKDIEAAKSFGTNVNADLNNGKQKTTYTIDGKEVENPLQTFMTDGTCIISGY